MDEDRRAVVRSRANPVVRRLRKAVRGGAAEGLCLVEGIRLIEEALAAGIEIVEAAASTVAETHRARPPADREARAVDAVARLPGGGHPRVPLRHRNQPGRARARPPAELCRGCVVPAATLRRGRCWDSEPGQSRGLLRAAEAAGATGAYLTEGSADPLSAKALRGSMGSAFRLPHVHGLATTEALRRLAARGVRRAACLSEGGTPFDRADLRGPIALVLGNEGAGLAA